MALQATFVANFSQFDKAVEAGKENLRTFEFGVKGVQRSLQQVTSSFDGSKIIKEATLAAAAVEKIGGVTKLTEQEQRRLNGSVTEALAKYRALGETAPAEMRKIAGELERVRQQQTQATVATNKTTQAFGGISAAASAIAPALAAAFSVGAIADFGRQLVDTAGQIQDLADRTGLSVEGVQRLSYAAKTTGSSLDTVTASVSQLSNRLTEGSAGTVRALDQIGLSITRIRQMDPEDAFLAVTDAVRRIPDPMRQTQLAMELFGKAGIELLPGIKQGFSDLTTEAERAGHVLREDTVQALDQVGESWEKFQDQIRVTTAEELMNFSRGVGAVSEAIRDAADEWARMSQIPKPLADANAFGQRIGAGLPSDVQSGLSFGMGALMRAYRTSGVSLVSDYGQILRDSEHAVRASMPKIGDPSQDVGVAGRAALAKTTDELTASERRYRAAVDSSLDAQVKQRREAESRAKAIRDLADSLSGADVARKVRDLDTAWRTLSEQQRQDPQIIARVVEQYGRMRGETNLTSVTLEKVFRANQEWVRVLEDTPRHLANVEGAAAAAGRGMGDFILKMQEARENNEKVLTRLGEGWNPFAIPIEAGPGGIGQRVRTEFDEVDKTLQRVSGSTLDVAAGLGGIATAFSQLAQIRPFDGWIQNAAELLNVMNIAQQAGGGLASAFGSATFKGKDGKAVDLSFGGFRNDKGGFDAGSIASGSMQAISSGIAAFGAMDQATNVKGRGNRALRGAMTGASIGANPALAASTMGLSVVAGAGIGALVGALRNPAFEDVFNRVAKNFGVKISDETAKAIAKLSKDVFRGDRGAAEIFSLDSIIGEGGGLKDKNFEQLAARFRDAFSMKETGKFMAEQTREVLAKNFGQFAQYVAQSNQLIGDSFTDVLALAKREGLVTDEMKQFVSGQTGRAGNALQSIMGPLAESLAPIQEAQAALKNLYAQGRQGSEDYEEAQTALNKAQAEFAAKGIDVSTQLERFGVIALGAFNGAKRSGLDTLSAVSQLAPALDQYRALMETTGQTEASVHVASLERYRALVESNQALIASTSGWNEAMLAVNATGGLTPDVFKAIKDGGLQTLADLSAAGFTENESLELMSDWLRQVRDGHKKLGIPIDETTQRLIEQATQLDLLGEKDPSKAMKQGFDQLTGTMGLLAKTMGAELPKSIQTLIDKLNEIPTDVQTTYTMNFEQTGSPGLPPGASMPDLPGAAGGIYATGPTATWFGEGGQPELGGPVGFMGDVLGRAMAKNPALLDGMPVARATRAERRDPIIKIYLNGDEITSYVARHLPAYVDLRGA